MIEAGYRCAICEETSGLEIDHIIEWSEVHEHKFENMIVLCAVCHARKTDTSNPRHINRASLQQIKSTLMMLNGRYSDLERRIIKAFQEHLAAHPKVTTPSAVIPVQMRMLVKYLIDDGIVSEQAFPGPYYPSSIDPELQDGPPKLTLTPQGREFIASLPTAA
jgi:HNH endonuclease